MRVDDKQWLARRVAIKLVQGESKKSDAFCYSNLPRVTCC